MERTTQLIDGRRLVVPAVRLSDYPPPSERRSEARTLNLGDLSIEHAQVILAALQAYSAPEGWEHDTDLVRTWVTLRVAQYDLEH
jgi:hypothetical protein